MRIRFMIPATLVVSLVLLGSTCPAADSVEVSGSPPHRSDANIIGTLHDTELDPARKGTIQVEGFIEDTEIDPTGIVALRPDIFKKGRFSAFDALVHVCAEREIDLKYHFSPELRTHVIDSIGGKENWWYAAHYHGGGMVEEPVHRMDTHPYKDWMRIEVYPVPQERVDEIQRAFRAEVERLERNGNKVVVPEVRITTPNQNLRFADVEVKPHGLRSDIFQPDVLAAADIMLSLADEGRISLDLTWLDNIASTLVQGYYFTRFNDEEAYGRAGFTFSMGEKYFQAKRQRRFGGNFFHMTSDIRVIVSPEYMHWQWTDLSRGGRTARGSQGADGVTAPAARAGREATPKPSER